MVGRARLGEPGWLGFCGDSWMLDSDRVSLINGVESGEKRRRMDGSASWRRSEGLRWRKLLRGASGDASMRWLVRADRGLTRVNKLITSDLAHYRPFVTICITNSMMAL